jgi:hypothetical protein
VCVCERERERERVKEKERERKVTSLVSISKVSQVLGVRSRISIGFEDLFARERMRSTSKS